MIGDIFQFKHHFFLKFKISTRLNIEPRKERQPIKVFRNYFASGMRLLN
jgi:hypothetical protein